MVESTLQQFIFGRPLIDDSPSAIPDVLALTQELTAEDALALYNLAALDPLAIDGILESQSFALIPLDEKTKLNGIGRLLLGRCHFQQPKQAAAIYQFVLLSSQALSRLGDIEPVLKALDKPLPFYSSTLLPIAPLPLPLPTTWTPDKSVVLLSNLLDVYLKGDMRLLLGILGAALSQGLVLCNFPANSEERLNLVRGLFLLLPALARPYLSFTTNTDSLNGNLPRLVFSEADGAPQYARINWQNPQLEESFFEHPYIAHLAKIWHENIIALVESIRSLDSFAANYMLDKELSLGLSELVHRHQLDLAVKQGELIPAADAINVLQSDKALGEENRLLYLRVLMRHALESRDNKITQFVSQAISSYPSLENALEPLFADALENQPDALYAFVRVRLSSDEIPDPKWLKRLHQAAQRSLSIALESGEAATIDSWLTLLSREPLRYELAPILHDGILAAREVAVNSSKLAQDLLIVAVKRQPETLPNLLQDETLLEALPDEIFAALREFNPEAIEKLADISRELFLLAIQQSIASNTKSISPTTIRSLWHLHSQQQTNTLPPIFRPHLLMLNLVEHLESMMENSLETLLTLVLATGETDNFFYELAPILATQGVLALALVDAILQSGRDLNDVMELLTKLLNEEWLQPQEVVDAYAFILAEREWDEDSQPLAEQLARVMTQHPETDAAQGVLWKLAELSGELKNEQMLKVALRRLLEAISLIPTETQIVESILRLRKAAQWSNLGRGSLSRWWRIYAREQSTVQLQKLDKALESKRNVEELRASVQTSLALRRILGNRSLEEFAEAIGTTYTILQALSEGFDPDDKLVDSAAIRSEIDSRADELAPDLRHVLATNLKELAHVIATLAEKRSKPSLMRSDESLERQLLTGEQQPQSAIDVMRWLSGYLDGVQKGEGE